MKIILKWQQRARHPVTFEDFSKGNSMEPFLHRRLGQLPFLKK